MSAAASTASPVYCLQVTYPPYPAVLQSFDKFGPTEEEKAYCGQVLEQAKALGTAVSQVRESKYVQGCEALEAQTDALYKALASPLIAAAQARLLAAIAQIQPHRVQLQAALSQVDAHFSRIIQPRLQQLKEMNRPNFTSDENALLGAVEEMRHNLTGPGDTGYWCNFSVKTRNDFLGEYRSNFEKALNRYNEIASRFFKPVNDEEIQATAEYQEIRDSIEWHHKNVLIRYQLVGGGILGMTAYQYVTSGRYPTSDAALEACYTKEALAEYKNRYS